MQQKAPKLEAKEKEKRKEKRRSSKMKMFHQNKKDDNSQTKVFSQSEKK